MEELLIKPVKYSLRLGKAFIAPFNVWVLFDHHNLKEILVRGGLKNFYSDLANELPELYKEMNKQPENWEAVYSQMEQSKRDGVNESLTILLNQSFVMMITVFDVFLNESLNTVIKKQPQLLKSLADNEKDITVSQIVDSQNYEEVFNRIVQKVLRRFDFKSIEQKIALLNKIGVDVENALALRFQKKENHIESSDGRNSLIQYYNQRHDIVHQDKHYIKTISELEIIANFFSSLIINFGIAIGKHFDIKTEFDFLKEGDVIKFSSASKEA